MKDSSRILPSLLVVSLCLTLSTHTIVGASESGVPQAATDQAPPELWKALQEIGRNTPKPAPEHPGNVFLEGEKVDIKVPASLIGKDSRWWVKDDQGKVVSEGTLHGDVQSLELGKLTIGWYSLGFLNEDGTTAQWTTAAVLAPLAEPVPQDSPVCVDSATSWFATNDSAKQERFARLAALAGVNWIRDRMSWEAVETSPARFAEHTTYDTAASLQARHGLKVLQVFHRTPGWAIDRQLDGERASGRFPRDLGVLYRYCKAMAQRYKGRVLAWEPWNEANITVFGGHTIDEMCAHQKAAYLGFKAGDPNLTVCWNVYAGSGTELHTQGILKNEVWPYFETYNIHSYSKPENYLDEFGPAREAACGRPIWISECGIPLPWKTERPWSELSREDELRQAKFIAKSYASSLFAGVNRHFFFILGNFAERSIQFGLLRHDQTPRPGYVALAAVGRFLAGARPLGRWSPTQSPWLRAYAFRARPDGQRRDVLVVWAEANTDDTEKWWSGLAIDAVYDYLGRPLSEEGLASLDDSPVFVVLRKNLPRRLVLEPARDSSEFRGGRASPVVLQLQMAHTTTNLDQQAHTVQLGTQNEPDLFAYNFSDKAVKGTVEVEQAPTGCVFEPHRWQIKLEAGERQALPCRLTMPSRGRDLAAGQWFRLRGDFADAGAPVLAFRLMGSAKDLRAEKQSAIKSAESAAGWRDNIAADARMSHRELESDGVLFEMHFGDADPWAYPMLRLEKQEIPDGGYDGLALTVRILEGWGDVRVQFVEENGASYIADALVRSDTARPQKVVVRFDEARWGEWSQPDPDGGLQPEKIRSVMVGMNCERHSAVKMAISDMMWVRF